MKIKLLFLFLVLASLAGVHQVAAQGTAFTYQGRLDSGGSPADGAYNFTFSLFSTNTNGVPIAGPLTNSAVAVSNGLFTVLIDFGALTPATNWLQIGVATNGVATFTPLTPRQQLTPAPYAVTVSAPAAPAGMALIPAGAFTMGDTLDGETDALPTNVTVSAFYMDVNLVSYSQWQSVYYWATNQGFAFVHPGVGKAANQPVQTVDWFDAVKWCNARSLQAGLTPVYYSNAALTLVFTNGESVPYTNWSASGYRLPTEAEWEKAARGGLSGQRFPWGNIIAQSLANYDANTLTNYDAGPNGYNSEFLISPFPYTSPVGYFTPNAYGLYDMAGNVFEWCWNWYGTPYVGGTDPRGPATGTYRVLRGGAWNSNGDGARCATRAYDVPTDELYSVGFRCVRRP